MRRADRLFRIVEYLKARRRAVRAEDLAQKLNVSVRTIYRDMSDLILSGVPVMGEAGIGYMLDKAHIVRPMMFDAEELEALIMGAQMVESWGDEDLAKAAHTALDKISASLPSTKQDALLNTFLFSFASQSKLNLSIDFSALRRSIRNKQYIEIGYKNESGAISQRVVRPLALVFFSPVWLLLGWCETRKDFRNFRLDRIKALSIETRKFRDEKGKRVQDYKP